MSEYNGWKNYESWAVALWIDNDAGSYEHAQELASEAKRQAKESADDVKDGLRPFAREAHAILADSLKEWMEEEAPDLGASVWADLLNAALSEVDWTEVAEHYL